MAALKLEAQVEAQVEALATWCEKHATDLTEFGDVLAIACARLGRRYDDARQRDLESLRAIRELRLKTTTVK